MNGLKIYVALTILEFNSDSVSLYRSSTSVMRSSFCDHKQTLAAIGNGQPHSVSYNEEVFWPKEDIWDIHGHKVDQQSPWVTLREYLKERINFFPTFCEFCPF